MKDSSLDQWHSRLERTVELINRRLDDPPGLQELAAAARISPFHLHRVWRALVGETVRQTVLRLRLEASEPMLEQKRSITETSMAVGFGTPQSYARAFRRRTGVSPTQHQVEHTSAAGAAYEEPEVFLERRGDVLVVAVRREGKPYTQLNSTFGQVWDWANSRGLLERLAGIYGVPMDDPESAPVDQLRYDACLDLGVTEDPPAPFRRFILPAGEYARVRHQGSYDELQEVTQRLVGEWLPRSGREPADFPVIHHFMHDPDETPVEDLLADVLLPLM